MESQTLLEWQMRRNAMLILERSPFGDLAPLPVAHMLSAIARISLRIDRYGFEVVFSDELQVISPTNSEVQVGGLYLPRTGERDLVGRGSAAFELRSAVVDQPVLEWAEKIGADEVFMFNDTASLVWVWDLEDEQTSRVAKFRVESHCD